MSIYGTPNPAATYREAENHGFDPVRVPYRVQHDGTLYSSLSPLATPHVFGQPTANKKFTEVIVNGETVYSEGSPSRLPFAKD